MFAVAGYLLFSNIGAGTTIVEGVDIEMENPVDVEIISEYDIALPDETVDVEFDPEITIEVDC